MVNDSEAVCNYLCPVKIILPHSELYTIPSLQIAEWLRKKFSFILPTTAAIKYTIFPRIFTSVFFCAQDVVITVMFLTAKTYFYTGLIRIFAYLCAMSQSPKESFIQVYN